MGIACSIIPCNIKHKKNRHICHVLRGTGWVLVKPSQLDIKMCISISWHMQLCGGGCSQSGLWHWKWGGWPFNSYCPPAENYFSNTAVSYEGWNIQVPASAIYRGNLNQGHGIWGKGQAPFPCGKTPIVPVPKLSLSWKMQALLMLYSVCYVMHRHFKYMGKFWHAVKELGMLNISLDVAYLFVFKLADCQYYWWYKLCIIIYEGGVCSRTLSGYKKSVEKRSTSIFIVLLLSPQNVLV